MHRVLYNQGAQTLYFAPHDHLARPVVASGTPTYAIVDPARSNDSAEYSIASGNAGTSSVDTTISAAAGPSESNPRLLTVDSAAGITVGRRYLLSVTGKRELVHVVDVVGTSVYLLHDLRQNYASGAALEGIELEATFPASEADDEDNLQEDDPTYQVVWTYTLDAKVHIHGETVVLSRYSVEPWITVEDLDEADPTMVTRARQRISPNKAIAKATKDIIAAWETRNVDIAYLRMSTIGNVLAVSRAMQYITRWNREIDDSERWRQEYEDLLRKVLSSSAAPKHTKALDRDDDQYKDPKPKRDIFDPV